MSGIIGHTMYAILSAKCAEHRELPIAPILSRHYGSFLCGAYLGCDIQTMPEAICVDTGNEVGYGTAPLERSPLTGGKVKPWTLEFEDKQYRPRDIHRMFYGRSHLVFGWNGIERNHTVPWDHLADYLAAVVNDAVSQPSTGQRKLAYLFGWMAHIVSDSLIKSIQPGIELHLLDGKYTPKNRPIQDLVTFNEIGISEFELNWAALLSDLADAPIEPIQLHYMRASAPQGELAQLFPNAWSPNHAPLLQAVMHENRRYQAIRNRHLLTQYKLKRSGAQRECSEDLSKITGGLRYQEMVGLANRAGLRHALWMIAKLITDLYERVLDQTTIAENPIDFDNKPRPSLTSQGPTWKEITSRWQIED